MREIGADEGLGSAMGVRTGHDAAVRRSQSESALSRPTGTSGGASSEAAARFPTVSIATAPEEYKGDIGPMSRLQQRPGIGFYPSGQVAACIH